MVEPALQPAGVHVHDEDRAAIEGDGERLRSAHPAAASGEGQGAGERAAEPFARDRAERLVRPLQDALRADVDPGAGGHLAVHREAEGLQSPELGPCRPVADEVGVGDEHPRRPLVRAEHADGLAGLHQQRLVGLQIAERRDDRVVGLPATGRASRPSVDDEVVGPLGDLGVEVVHEHPQRRLGLPALRAELRAARRANGSCSVHGSRSFRTPVEYTKTDVFRGLFVQSVRTRWWGVGCRGWGWGQGRFAAARRAPERTRA